MNQAEELYLIRRVLKGKTEEFTPLVERYSRSVFLLVFGIVQRQEEAEELTQDIFVRAYTKLSTYGARSRFSTWLYRIAYNMAVSALRRKQRDCSLYDVTRVERMVDHSDEEFEDAQLSEQELQRLVRALDRLLSDERTLIQLHYYENRTLAECGEILGLSESNCKVRLYRIRKKLGLWMREKE